MTDLSADDLLTLLHSHSAAFMAADPSLSAAAAMDRSCHLAVLIYDQVKVEAALRVAATKVGAADTLARIVGTTGGASAALTPSD